MLTIADIAQGHDYRGLKKDLEILESLEDKSKIGNGSTFVDIESGDVYFYDAENETWNLI